MKKSAWALASASLVVIGGCSSSASAPSNEDIRKAIMTKYGDVSANLACAVNQDETQIFLKARALKTSNPKGDEWIMDCTGSNALGMQHQSQWLVEKDADKDLFANPYEGQVKGNVHQIAAAGIADRTADASSAGAPPSQPDYSTPDSAYQPLPVGDGLPLQLAFQYVAHANGTVDYVQLARLKNNDYDNQPDSFKRQDMIAALKPELDRGIAFAKGHPYARWHYPVTLGAYDATTKSFRIIIGYQPATSGQIGRVGFADGSMLRDISRAFPVTDEALARQIEAKRAAAPAYPPVFGLNVFAFVQTDNQRHQDGGNFGGELTVVVTKLQLTDGDGGSVIAEVKATP